MTQEQEWEEAFAAAIASGMNCDDAAEWAQNETRPAPENCGHGMHSYHSGGGEDGPLMLNCHVCETVFESTFGR